MKAWVHQFLLVLKWWFTVWLRLVLLPWRWWLAKRRNTDQAQQPDTTQKPTLAKKNVKRVAASAPVNPVPAKPKVRKRRVAAFPEATYAHATGQRGYKLYGVPVIGAKPVPLVVMLHGCKQSPDDFALGTRMNQHADVRGCMVLYPAQSRFANGYGCWNWFNSRDQAREGGETALLAGMVRHVMASHPVDPQQVVVMGLSAGAAMAVNLACAYPELVRGLGIHSGLPYGAAQGARAALKAMKEGASTAADWPPASQAIPSIVFHGDSDEVVHPINAVQLVAQRTSTPFQASARAALATALPEPVQTETVRATAVGSHTRRVYRGVDRKTLHEYWLVHGAGHAWSGGDPDGSYTDANGPDATREMLRFLLGAAPV